VSKVFSISKNTAAVGMLLLKLRVTWSVNFMHCSVVLWCARNPNWLALSKFFFSVCLKIIFRITFSKSLLVVDNRLIGRRFSGNLGSFPGFGKVIMFASFQHLGKWESRMQLLNRFVRFTSRLLGSYVGGTIILLYVKDRI
jgi:hypothetical protein